MTQQANRNPWLWVPSLYLYQGIPYSIVMTTSGLIYKMLGISVASLTFWTSLLYLPWALKPLWSPYVEVISTKRNWIIITQFLLGIGFIVAGSVLPLKFFFPLTIGILAVIAICSASHDIAADGFYMQALDQHTQAYFVGIRSTFYRIAMLTATGLTPLAAGLFQEKAGFNVAYSWMLSLGLLGLLLLILGLYHKWVLPRPLESKTAESVNLRVYWNVFISFFRKPGILPALLFFLFYRFGESQSIKIATPFLVDSRASGGIGLTAAQYGIAYGTIGMISLMAGGILGGICAARYGLKKLIWLMAISMNLPNIGLLYIAITQPMPGDFTIYLAIIFEQFGYGFGFTAYMLYMLYFVGNSKFKTAEYAIGTSLMAFAMMLPGMMSGYIQELVGYSHFFIYVLFCTLPGMAIIPFLKIDPGFGIKAGKISN